jgi:hypothetical protein
MVEELENYDLERIWKGKKNCRNISLEGLRKDM